jgi:hypothetical protein
MELLYFLQKLYPTKYNNGRMVSKSDDRFEN